MKILEIIPKINGGGAEKLVYDWTNLFVKNHKVCIITFYNEFGTERYEKLKESGVDIITINKKKGFSLSTLIKVSNIIKKFKPDVIHSHLSVNLYLFPYYVFHGNQIGFHTVHNLAEKEQGGIHKKITNWLYHHRKVKPVAISDLVEDSIVSEYNLQKGSFPNIYNGIELDKFQSERKISKVQNFIAIGRLTYQKNYPLMLDAFKIALEKYPNLTLTILGEGDLAEDIEAIAKKLGIYDNLNLAGYVADVGNYINKSDCMILSSDYEGLPLSVAECMAYGLPVVATKAGGVVELVADSENGYLSNIGEIQSLADNIIKMAELDSEQVAKMSAKSKELSLKFDIKKCAEEYEKIFLSCQK